MPSDTGGIILDGLDFLRDEGTVLVFEGRDEDGQVVTFAVDHRLGHDLREAIAAFDDPPLVEVESWQILSTITE